jgi:hypothetical protein
MVPALMKILEVEAVRNPGKPKFMGEFGFAVDVMRMLGQLGDPRPVNLLVRIMEGMDGRANLAVRDFARETMERLTYHTFRVESDNPITPLAVMGAGALVLSRDDRQRDRAAEMDAVATLYARWVAGEGRDSARWLDLARQRARRALEGDDPVATRNAIAFLAGEWSVKGHDDQPDATMLSIARMMNRPGRAEGDGDSHALAVALANYGPAARPYAQSLLRYARRQPSWSSYHHLAEVGGEEAMAFMVRSLPELRDKVERLGFSVEADSNQLVTKESRAAREALLTYNACRWGIERWAGRSFTRDEDIAAWWRQAGGKTQGQWLEENLDRTAAEADGGDAKAQHLIRGMVPDLPHADDDLPFDPPWRWRNNVPYREGTPGPYRGAWLKENRATLDYDEKRSCFVLREER